MIKYLKQITKLLLLLALFIGNNMSYAITNNHGAQEVITDRNQSIVWKASYTPYGKATVTTETITNNIRLPGQYFDAKTGLHYNYFRYYDAEIGRYVTSDPIGLNGGVNTYGYVLGNPTKYTDSLGLNPDVLMITDPAYYYEIRADEIGVDPFTHEGADAVAKYVAAEALNSFSVMTFMLPVSSGLALGSCSSKMISVTRWQNPASTALKSGDWVMKGGSNIKNWVMSGKMNPLRPKHHVPLKQGRTFTVPKSSTQFPKGIEKFKGLPPWNQRIMK